MTEKKTETIDIAAKQLAELREYNQAKMARFASADETKTCDSCGNTLSIRCFRINGTHGGKRYYKKTCIICERGELKDVKECKGIYSLKYNIIRPYFLHDYQTGVTLYGLSKKYGIAYTTVWQWEKKGFLPPRQTSIPVVVQVPLMIPVKKDEIIAEISSIPK